MKKPLLPLLSDRHVVIINFKREKKERPVRGL